MSRRSRRCTARVLVAVQGGGFSRPLRGRALRRGAVFWIVCLVALLALGAPASANYAFETKWGSEGSGDGQFSYPQGVAVNAAGNIYVADSGNHRIQKFDSSGSFLAKWGSQGSGDGQFSYPEGVAVDASGNVYVTDPGNRFSPNLRIQKFDSSGSFLAKWDSEPGDGNLPHPAGIAVDDATGNVYVADRDNYWIQKFDASGSLLAKWGGLGSGDGEFWFPDGVAVDAAGDVYVTDAGNNRIQKFDSSGSFLSKWGSEGSGDGQFFVPRGVAVDAFGDVYIVDALNHRIQKFTEDNVAPAAPTPSDTDPDSPANDNNPEVKGSGAESGSTVKIYDNASCTGAPIATGTAMEFNGATGITATVPDDQTTNLHATATDYGGNVSVCSASLAFTEDSTAPLTTFDSSPPDATNDNTPTFSFSSSEPGSSFECRVDADALALCASPYTSAPLSDGEHTFSVGTTDPAGNSSEVSRSFTVDTIAPAAPTLIDADPDSPADDNAPEIKGSAEAGSTVRLYANASCSASPEVTGSAASFASPGLTVAVADDSTSSFGATATDAAGNASSCSYSPIAYVEDSTAPQPTIDSGPSDATSDNTPTFSFSSNEAGSTLECSFDDSALTACTSPRTLWPLADGPHIFRVRAIDLVGHSREASRSFTVDTIAPIFSAASLSATAFHVGSRPTHVAAALVPTGTTIRYRLSELAAVRLVIERKLAGRRRGHSCVRPTPALRGATKCTRYRRQGVLTRAGKPGANSVRFSGRIGRNAIAPGQYRLTLRAKDAAGNSADVQRLSFRIVAKPRTRR